MEFFTLFKFILTIVLYLVFSPIVIIVLIINYYYWNKGICRVCNSDRYYLDFRPDKMINHHYVCGKCGHRFLSFIHRISPGNDEVKSLIRENKIKKIL